MWHGWQGTRITLDDNKTEKRWKMWDACPILIYPENKDAYQASDDSDDRSVSCPPVEEKGDELLHDTSWNLYDNDLFQLSSAFHIIANDQIERTFDFVALVDADYIFRRPVPLNLTHHDQWDLGITYFDEKMALRRMTWSNDDDTFRNPGSIKDRAKARHRSTERIIRVMNKLKSDSSSALVATQIAILFLVTLSTDRGASAAFANRATISDVITIFGARDRPDHPFPRELTDGQPIRIKLLPASWLNYFESTWNGFLPPNTYGVHLKGSWWRYVTANAAFGHIHLASPFRAIEYMLEPFCLWYIYYETWLTLGRTCGVAALRSSFTSIIRTNDTSNMCAGRHARAQLDYALGHWRKVNRTLMGQPGFQRTVHIAATLPDTCGRYFMDIAAGKVSTPLVSNM